MNVVWCAYIQRDRHPGIAHKQCAPLGVTDNRPTGVGRIVAGNLHEEEREVAFAPLVSPVGDERGENAQIVGRACSIAVSLALIPNGAFDREAGVRGDHGVEESSGRPCSPMIRRDARVRRKGLSCCLGSGILACVIGPELVGTTLVTGDRRRIRKDRGEIGQPIRADPGVSGRAAPCGVDESNGNFLTLGDLPAKEVGDRGEVAGGLRRAFRPGV